LTGKTFELPDAPPLAPPQMARRGPDLYIYYYVNTSRYTCIIVNTVWFESIECKGGGSAYGQGAIEAGGRAGELFRRAPHRHHACPGNSLLPLCGANLFRRWFGCKSHELPSFHFQVFKIVCVDRISYCFTNIGDKILIFAAFLHAHPDCTPRIHRMLRIRLTNLKLNILAYAERCYFVYQGFRV